MKRAIVSRNLPRAVLGVLLPALVFPLVWTAQAADTFYLLTRSGSPGNYRYAAKCFAPNGVLLKRLDLPAEWNQSSDCSAIAADGATVWVAHRYDRDFIHGFPFWTAGGGGEVAYQTTEPPTYGYGKGLALQDGILYLVREHLDAGTDRVEKYRVSDGAYVGQWKTTPHSTAPWSAQAASTALFVLDGGGAGVVVFERASGNYSGSFPVSGAGPLCGNASYMWIRAVDGITWQAYGLGGSRQPAADVILTGTEEVRDAYMAAGPDLTPSANALDFGVVQVGSQSVRSLAVQNRGSSALTLQGLTLPTPELTCSSAFPISLPAGQSVDLQLTFAPTAGVPLAGAMLIDSTDPMAPHFPIALSGTGAKTRFYVVAGNPGAGNGQSWATAFASINAALASPLVLDNAEIWVRQGTYNLSGKLSVNRRLSIYGGFSGSETNLSQRDWLANETVVDGGHTNECFEVLTNATVDGFTVQNGQPATYVMGGGFTVKGGDVTIAHCLIRNNTAKMYGGAVGADYAVRSLTLRGCVISNNAGYYSSAVYVPGATLVVEDCVIRDNLPGSGSTPTSGGGIFCGGSASLTVRNSLIAGHTGIKSGGGIYAEDVPDVLVEGCEIRDNAVDNSTHPERGGGGIHVFTFSVQSSIRILNSTIAGNEARDGGGIQANGSNIVVSGCTIVSNTAFASWPGTGGGMTLSSEGDISIQDTVIGGNAAQVDGGGANFSAAGRLELSSVTLAGNRCTADGGGARMFADRIRMVNCLVADNAAGSKGGGIYVNQQYNGIEVTGCTVANNSLTNSGLGAGLYVQQGGWLYFYDSIAWGNHDTGAQRDGLQIYGGVVHVVEYSDVQDTYWGARPTCMNQNPLFADADGPDNDPATWQDADYRLQSASPCIDTGDSLDPRAPGADLAHTFRPQDGNGDGASVHDMGCYESADPDADGDGMDDAWELANGVDDPNDDPEGDGSTNYEEYVADTDPHVKDALSLAVADTDPATGDLTLNWQSSTACLYTVQVTAALDQPWTDLAGWVAVPGTGGEMSVVVPAQTDAGFARLLVARAP